VAAPGGAEFRYIVYTINGAAPSGRSGERRRQLAGLGIELVIGLVPGMERLAPLGVVGREIIPAVAEL
jgi:hypothetical protein